MKGVTRVVDRVFLKTHCENITIWIVKIIFKICSIAYKILIIKNLYKLMFEESFCEFKTSKSYCGHSFFRNHFLLYKIGIFLTHLKNY